MESDRSNDAHPRNVLEVSFKGTARQEVLSQVHRVGAVVAVTPLEGDAAEARVLVDLTRDADALAAAEKIAALPSVTRVRPLAPGEIPRA